MSKNEIILEALREYERNNWESHDDKWQDQINEIIEDYKHKVLEETYE